jgi:hypothetical protein
MATIVEHRDQAQPVNEYLVRIVLPPRPPPYRAFRWSWPHLVCRRA